MAIPVERLFILRTEFIGMEDGCLVHQKINPFCCKPSCRLATLVGWDDESLRQTLGFVNLILHNTPTHDTVAVCDWQKDYGTNCD